MRLKRHHDDATLITEAPPDPQAEFNYRRKRYAITMGIRVVCLVLAAAFYQVIWVWPIFALGAFALPWIAVVLANDKMPKRSSRFQRYSGAGPKELPPARNDDRGIDE